MITHNVEQTGGEAMVVSAACKLAAEYRTWTEDMFATIGCLDAPDRIPSGSTWAVTSKGGAVAMPEYTFRPGWRP